MKLKYPNDRIRVIGILSLIILFAMPLQVLSQSSKEYCRFVNTSKQNYSYLEMRDDLDSLAKYYSNCFRYELEDSTYQGHPIPVAYFGDSLATKFIMIQATMHAREFMATQLNMALLEYYASNFNKGTYHGKSYRELFKGILFVLIPMVNPDGVEISQNGVDGAVTDDVRQWLTECRERGNSLNQIKSNALGVDLNRNFSNGFGKAKFAQKKKSLYHYMGDQPYSEIESKLMLKVSRKYRYSVFLNYHTSGNLIFYGCLNAKKEVNAAAQRVANKIKALTGYKCYGPKSAKPSGTWADEVEIKYNRPSVTIEIGTKNPVPIQEFKSIFNKNIHVWAAIAEMLQKKLL